MEEDGANCLRDIFEECRRIDSEKPEKIGDRLDENKLQKAFLYTADRNFVAEVASICEEKKDCLQASLTVLLSNALENHDCFEEIFLGRKKIRCVGGRGLKLLANCALRNHCVRENFTPSCLELVRCALRNPHYRKAAVSLVTGVSISCYSEMALFPDFSQASGGIGRDFRRQ
ncbi:unnamed protein product [Caenorhabditis auriculariae]|uniref:Uncharacterized protein n=1 Tax=Caenorhabditis auriculariae TaxID=2777116 RepID=A0A8S1HW04_9PELO|nr:unnamed protein product [Caenorhabditis auriculariae]